MYIVASSPVCATTRLPASNLCSLSQQAVPSLRLHERTSLGVQDSYTPTTRPFCPGQCSTIGFLPSLWAGHRSDKFKQELAKDARIAMEGNKEAFGR